MSFTDEEIGYLRSQRLARIATVSPEGQPDVMPVGYQFDGNCLLRRRHGSREDEEVP
jgi:hypothetical protein